MRLDIRRHHGCSTTVRRVGLPQVRHVSTVRDHHQHVEPGVRGVPDVHQRRGVLHTDGVLSENVLRHPRLSGVELERLADRQTHGAAGVHRPAVLGAHSVRLADGHLRLPSGVTGTGQGVHGVRVAAELVLQPVLVRYTHQTVQERLRDDMQGHRGVARHEGHRPVPAQFQLQQPADTGQHQQLGGQVVPGQLSASAVQLQRQAAGRQVGEDGRDVLRLAERQVPQDHVVPATGVGVGPAAVHAQRPVRVSDSGDPAEAAQASVVDVVERELQFVAVGLVAAASPPSPSPSPLRRAAAAARPETAAGQLVDSDQEDVAGLEPVEFEERQFRFREHGQHEREHPRVQVERDRRRPLGIQAAAHAAVGRVGRGGTVAGVRRHGGRRRWRQRLFAEQTHRAVFGHHTVGGRGEQRADAQQQPFRGRGRRRRGRRRRGQRRHRRQGHDDDAGRGGRDVAAEDGQRLFAGDHSEREDHAARFETFVAAQLKRFPRDRFIF